MAHKLLPPATPALTLLGVLSSGGRIRCSWTGLLAGTGPGSGFTYTDPQGKLSRQPQETFLGPQHICFLTPPLGNLDPVCLEELHLYLGPPAQTPAHLWVSRASGVCLRLPKPFPVSGPHVHDCMAQ